jgi:DNA-binding NarL/FixJ family response regulator
VFPVRPIRVLVVDDYRLFVDGLSLLLGNEDDIEVVGTSGSGNEMAEILLHAPDVVLVGVHHSDQDGILLTRRITQSAPEVRVILISGVPAPEVVSSAVEAGASGILSMSGNAEDLSQLVRQVAAGASLVPQGLAGAVGRRQRVMALDNDGRYMVELTIRQLEILQAIADGKSTAEIARSLSITPMTVRSHIKTILVRLGVHTRLQAVTLAIRGGLIREPSERAG